MLRALARQFGIRPNAVAHPLGHLWDQLNRPHRDRPGLLALFRRINNGLDGEPAGDQSCTLMQESEGGDGVYAGQDLDVLDGGLLGGDLYRDSSVAGEMNRSPAEARCA